MTTSSRAHEPTLDPEFYYTFTPVFEVDSVLFRIPEHAVRESKTFCDMISLLEGREAPLILAGVTADEFRDFLRVLLASPYKSKRATKPSSWLNVVKVATHWDFDSVRTIAIDHIQRKEDCVVRLAVARQYDVHALLPSAIDDVLNREKPLTLAESKVLGFELALRVMTYREEWLRRPKGGEEDSDRAALEEEKMRYVERIFGDDFAKALRMGKDMLSKTASSASTAGT